jgi:hypothetical protein
MPDSTRRFVTLPDAAAFLGMTTKAIRKRVERRTIPFRRAGKRLIFDLAELEKWATGFPGVSLDEAIQRAGEAKPSAAQ